MFKPPVALIVVTWLVSWPHPLLADDQLRYSIELLQPSERAKEPNGFPVLGLQGTASQPRRKFSVRLSLTNVGTTEQLVFWPDSDFPDVFQLEFVHLATGQRVPVLNGPTDRTPGRPLPTIAAFRRLLPGQSLSCLIEVGDRDGYRYHAVLRKAGAYKLTAQLKLDVNHRTEESADKIIGVPDVWMGSLEAEPVEVSLEEDLTFGAGRPVSLQGQVRSYDGSPIADAIVHLRHSTAPEETFNFRHAEYWESLVTDSQGVFQFTGLPDESDYSLTAATPDGRRAAVVYTHEDFLSRKPLFLDIAQTHSVRGRVTDGKGQPLALVRVNSNCYTDQDGRFETQLPRPADGELLPITLWRRDLVRLEQSVPWSDAIGSELRMTMFRRTELSIAGVARFQNDQPVAKAKLNFTLSIPKRPSTETPNDTQVVVETDAEGRFVLVLPSNDVYLAAIAAEEEPRSGASRRWSGGMARLQRGQMPLALRFDNRGRIIVRVFQGTKLTRDQTVAISIRPTSTNRNVIRQRLAAQESGRVFGGLEPGDYVVTARVEAPPYQQVATTVTIPDNEPCRALAVVRLPKLEYGSVQGRVLAADGESPSAAIPVYLSSKRTHQTTFTDDQGMFQFPRVLTGQFSCNIVAQSGLTAKAPATGIVHPNQEATAGDLVLDNHPSGWGTVSGSLIYPDGMPVVGQTLLSVHGPDNPWFSLFGNTFLFGRYHEDDPEGMRARAGDGVAAFEHHGTANPRNFVSATLWDAPSFRRQLYVSVQVEADKQTVCNPREKSTTLDIQLQPRERQRIELQLEPNGELVRTPASSH